MITKKQYAYYLIDKFKRLNDIPAEVQPDMLVEYVFQSTTLGLALEYLGIINPESYPDLCEYLSNRGGIAINYIDRNADGEEKLKFNILTIREMFDLLPEELPEDNENVEES